MTIPRPEYPRPQFVRAEWLSLNGEWEFAFDDGDHGLSEGWQDRESLEARINVPFPYQCELSGIHDTGIHELVWYARDFEVPAAWSGRRVVLNFGAVDYRTVLWINGREAGHNRGGHVPFCVDVTPYVQDGRNRLTLRVEDRQDPRQPRGKQASSGQPHGIDYYCTTGIWQSVWLEPVSTFHLDDLRITPVGLDAVEVAAHLHAPSAPWELEVEALDGERVVAAQRVRATGAVFEVQLRIPDARPWSPESPHLYDLRVRLLSGGEVLDEVRSYFGLRQVRIEDGRLLLNGEPVFLAMVLDQGYWPESYLAAPSDDALRADVEWIRRLGYNGARKHQKIEDPRWLYWCDRLGLLVWAEMPNARAWSPEAEEALLAEWERAVERDYNHPSIITWVPVNESMGFPELKEGHPAQHAFLERIVAATRRLDSTRPVIDNDGWEHTDVTDILAVHDYSHGSGPILERYSEAMAGGPMPPRIWSGRRAVFAPGCEYHGQPFMLTEVGGYLLKPALPKEAWDRLYAVYDSFTSPEELLAKYEDLMDGLARLPFLAGFCYTQLTDIEQEINGLLTYDRRPKVDPDHVAEIHRRCFAGKGKEIRPLTVPGREDSALR